MDPPAFAYRPTCSSAGCGRDAIYKIAAPWSFGAGRELKNYGLSCEEHRAEVLADAEFRAGLLAPAEGEQVGPLGAYVIRAGVRDAELDRAE